jgi:hypothetical protein
VSTAVPTSVIKGSGKPSLELTMLIDRFEQMDSPTSSNDLEVDPVCTATIRHTQALSPPSTSMSLFFTHVYASAARCPLASGASDACAHLICVWTVLQWLAGEMEAAYRRVKGAPFANISPVRISFNNTLDSRPASRGGRALDGSTTPALTFTVDGGDGDGLSPPLEPPADSRLLAMLERGLPLQVDRSVGGSDSATDMSFREQCGKVLCELSKPCSARLQIIHQVRELPGMSACYCNRR